jgi:hypothetical protein
MITKERDGIRAIFLDRHESYGLREAARILVMSSGDLKREAEEDQREAYRSGGAWRFTWRQVACAALRRWTLAEIHEALGSDAATALPPLLSLRAVTLQLPEFIVCALETAAAGDATSLDAFLHWELMDFAGTCVEETEAAHPGFTRAYLFPGRE